MKIQYISCHAVLEYDEVQLLTDIGHEVYANGCYRDPNGAYTLPRPAILGAPFSQHFFDLTAQYPKTALPHELIEPYDTLIFMSGENEQPLLQNWENIKHKRVILRMIGQSTPVIERSIAPLVAQGLQIIRYSPKERNIADYAGEHALIRFYKDEHDLCDWTGDDKRPVNFTQTLKGRGAFAHYDMIMSAMIGFEGMKVYGSGNADLGKFNGGEVPYDKLKEILRKARVFVYGGTWPASYTLSFMEAMMTGTPIVAFNKKFANVGINEQIDYYEIDDIIQDGVSGFVCGSISEMRDRITQLINDDALAQSISEAGRARAIELFGKAKIADQWKTFLNGGVK